MKKTSFVQKVKAFVVKHKIISAIAAVIVLAIAYRAFAALTAKAAPTQYAMAVAERGTIVSSVTGSGQVSTSNSVDIKPKVSGDVTSVPVAAGDQVVAGQAIAYLDATDALQAYASAKNQLAADELQFQKDTVQAPINYQKDLDALTTAKDNLATDYNSAFNDLTSTYLDGSSVIAGAENALYGYDFDNKKVQWNLDVLMNVFTKQDVTQVAAFQTAAKNDYATARSSYNAGVLTYQATPRTSTTTAIDSLLAQTVTVVTDVAQSLQSDLNFFGSVADLADTYNINLPSSFNTVQNNTRTSLSTANSHLSALLADKKTLDNDKQAITNAEQTITLDQVGNTNGSNPISLQISKNSLAKEEQDLANQETNLSYYTVRAPFAGTLSKVDVQKGDSASSGSAIATIVTHDKIANISLNEIDAAKVAVGQPVTLTFDAVDALTIAGTVSQVDTVGTVSQGVVTYNIEIGFDTQDQRVKSGMSVNASIATNVAQNVLMVPNSAVKSQGTTNYVLVFPSEASAAGAATTSAPSSSVITSPTPPVEQIVQVGVSNDTYTEITQGLTEGDRVVSRTITASTGTASTGSAGTPSALNLLGGGATRTGTVGAKGGGGNAVFISR